MELLTETVTSVVIPLCLLLHCIIAQTPQEDEVLRYVITEETPVGTAVADLPEDYGLTARYPLDTLNILQYSFLSDPGVNISVGSMTGLLFTDGRIDRDVVCPYKEECQIRLDVAVQPVTYFEIIKVVIIIEDINDNTPTFPESLFLLNIKESASVNSSFVLPPAHDPDSPKNSVIRYEVLPATPKSKFALKVTSKADGSTDVRLVLKRSLDRETEEGFSISVVAFDGGLESKLGQMEVKITVIDSNDNDPVFENSTYEISISEDIPLRSMVLRVRAKDKDEGANGEVIYGFSMQTKDMYGHQFGIDQDSGELYIKAHLDHEETAIYHLMVTAQDLGPDSRLSDATVVIHVEDVNDNAPQITVNTLTASATNLADISEASPVGTFVAYVIVKDPDGGQNGAFNCSLDDNTFILERRYETEYRVVTGEILDRESIDTYNLGLVCKDGGTEPKISVQYLQVKVIDVNDNTPIFAQPSYAATLMENSYIGASVMQVNATDKDIGSNGAIYYSLSGEGSIYFTISTSGEITARRSIDHEENAEFEFYVKASDQGVPSNTGTAIVVISIEDVNDEVPEFTSFDGYYSFSVHENQPGGVSVGTVTAEDRDSPPFNSFLYTFSPGKGTQDAFSLDPSTGLIRTKKPLDREEQAVYYLVAIATDENLPVLSSTCSVTIYVMDENDNDPVFEYPTPYNNTVHISNKAPKDYVITMVIAKDADIEKNARIKYTLHGSNTASFAIHPTMGTITVHTDSLHNIDFQNFELTILAKDNGSPPKTALATLNIVVNKSIPFPEAQPQTALLTGSNFIIVISLSVVCAIITVILVAAILVIKRSDRNKRQAKYNCRLEALQTISAKEGGGMHSVDSSPVKNGTLRGGNGYIDHSKTEEGNQYSALPASSTFTPSTLSHSGYTVHPQSPSHVDQYSNHVTPTHQYSSHVTPTHQYPGHVTPSHVEQYGVQTKVPVWQLHGRDIHTLPRMNTSVQEADRCSQHSGDGSNTDSGRGPSEEGERIGIRGSQSQLSGGPGRLPPHPPPPPTRPITSTYYGPSGTPDTSWDVASASVRGTSTTTSLHGSDNSLVHVTAKPARVVPTNVRQTHPGNHSNRLHGNQRQCNHGNGVRPPGSSQDLDVIPERTYLPNTMTEMKSVVV